MSAKRLTRCGRRRALAALAGLAAFVGGPAAVMAQTPVLTPDLPDVAAQPATSSIAVTAAHPNRKLTVSAGKSIIVDLPSDASEVFVGNPAVANAVVRSARRLYVMAVGNGQTTIFALDKQGRQIATLELLISGRDLTALKALLDTAIPSNEIKVSGISDSVILTGTVASASDAQKAEDIANAYVGYTQLSGGSASSSGNGSGAGGANSFSSSINFGSTSVVNGKLINTLTIRGQDQVTLKVTVVEIQRSIVKQLGINLGGAWGTVGSGGLSGSANSIQNPTVNSVFSSSGSTAGGVTAALDYLGQKNSLTSSLQAYERNGVAHTLAEPNVTAISGETASFKAGGTLPVAASSSIDPTTGRCTVTYQQQQYGVELDFTPTVLSEGRISLHLTTIVNEPDSTVALPFGCSNQVGFRTRSNTTTVELPSGGSIVSAGLIQKSSQQAIAGTPGLMNLPILGALFRSRDYQRSESELMIIVTPYLVKPLRPDQISKPDDGFTDASDPQSWLLGRMNKIYSTADNPELIHNYRGRVGFIAD